MNSQIQYCYSFVLILLISLIGFWGCEENPNEVALDDRNGEVVTDTLYATADNTYRLPRKISTLVSSRILLGEYGGIKTRIIMRLANLRDSISIQKAWMEFPTAGITGNTQSAPFAATAYPIREFWLSDTVEVWQGNPDNNVDFSTPLGSFTVTPNRSDTLQLHFNAAGLQRLHEWADTSNGIDNNGFILHFENAAFIKEFRARDDLNQTGPRLFYEYRNPSDTTVFRDSLLVLSDAYLRSGRFQTDNPQRLYITTLDSGYVSLLNFDLTPLVERYSNRVIVESANLELPVDWGESFVNRDFGPNLVMFPIVSPLDSSGIRVDSRFDFDQAVLVTAFSADSTYLQVPDENTSTAGLERRQLAANFLQLLLNDPDAFTGFVIQSISLTDHLAKFAFYRSSIPDPNMRPRLIITSLLLPEERF